MHLNVITYIVSHLILIYVANCIECLLSTLYVRLYLIAFMSRPNQHLIQTDAVAFATANIVVESVIKHIRILAPSQFTIFSFCKRTFNHTKRVAAIHTLFLGVMLQLSINIIILNRMQQEVDFLFSCSNNCMAHL